MWTRLVMFAFALVVAAGAGGQNVASQKKGEGGETSFFVENLDSVGLFNGSLTVKLELGGAFPTGPGFDYGFRAIFNSVVWDSEVCPTGPAFFPIVEKHFNAGPGWLISFGRLEDKTSHWNFIAPGGSRHGLYDQLHPNSPTASGVYYSTSGSYLRMQHFPSGSTLCELAGECALLEFRDGRVQEYRPRTVKGEETWLPTRMTDPFGNWMAIAYPANGNWEITDVHGRRHDVVFGGTVGDYERVTELRVTQFGGGQATYTFAYTSVNLERQGFVPASCTEVTPTVTADMLTSVTFPDGSFYGFDYYRDDDLTGGVLSGGMSSLRLRSGGEHRYEYARLVISSQPEGDSGPGPSPVDVTRTHGVVRKEVALSVGGEAEGAWTYDYIADFDITVPGETGVPCHRRTIVTTPEGDQSVHYFGTSLRHRWSFALPFTRCGAGVYDNTPPFLSVEMYDGTVASGTKVRSVFVEYESDSLIVGRFDAQDHNARIAFKRTVYHDDGDLATETQWTDFDGYGSYRTRVETSFDGETRTFFTNHNPGSGTLVVDPETGSTTGSTFVLKAVTDPWVLDIFDQRTLTDDGSATTVEEYCFGSEGLPERVRTLAGASRAGSDFLKVITRDAQGFPERERLYGGDDTPVTDHVYDSLCDMTLPSEPAFQTDHTYSVGVLESSLCHRFLRQQYHRQPRRPHHRRPHREGGLEPRLGGRSDRRRL